jgi:hypothetical protein
MSIVYVAFKTTNTIELHLKLKRISEDTYNQSGIRVYQLQCSEYPLKDIGQTGRAFKVRYREHINAVRTNKPNSKFVQHVLETGYVYDKMDQTMKILHIEKKGQKINTLERDCIYTEGLTEERRTHGYA